MTTPTTGGNNLSNQIYSELRHKILHLELTPGQKISEMQLSQSMNCSRIPVRDAFRKLNLEGLLEIRPQIGSFVPYIDLEQSKHSHYIRECLEFMVIRDGIRQHRYDSHIAEFEEILFQQRQAADTHNLQLIGQLDIRFHDAFYETAGKIFVNEASSSNADYLRLRFLSLENDTNLPRLVLQHQRVLDAVIARDESALETAIHKHFENIYHVMEEKWPCFAPYVK